MADPFVAEIRIFYGNFAPRGWAFCHGQIMPLSQNTALFSLLGTTYGGNGQTTFALPDLEGKYPVHSGYGGSYSGSGVQLGEQSPHRSHSLEKTGESRPRGGSQKKIPAELPAQGINPDLASAKSAELREALTVANEQVQAATTAYGRILGHVNDATTHLKAYEDQSKNSEFLDAGKSLASLMSALKALNDDPDSLAALQAASESLASIQNQIRQQAEFQEVVVSDISVASNTIARYQTQLAAGAFSEAGASLESLKQSLLRINHLWGNVAGSKKEEPKEIPQPASDPEAIGFLSANFIVAIQGVYPPRT